MKEETEEKLSLTSTKPFDKFSNKSYRSLHINQ